MTRQALCVALAAPVRFARERLRHGPGCFPITHGEHGPDHSAQLAALPAASLPGGGHCLLRVSNASPFGSVP